jgi:hypothetical protein
MKIHDHAGKHLPLDNILSHMNPIHALHHISLRFSLILVLKVEYVAHSMVLRIPNVCYSYWPRTWKVLGGRVNARYSSGYSEHKNPTPEG